MKSELAEEIFDVVAARSVAVDRIRFAIKHTEQFAPQTEPMREAELQLLDAQERLEGVDRRFQRIRSIHRLGQSGSDRTAWQLAAGTGQ